MSITVTKSSEETQKLAFELAKDTLSVPNKEKTAVVFALDGILGAGKTTFTQGFSKGLGVEEDITSPTFLILKEYDMHKHKLSGGSFKNFYHVDCYRLKDEKDVNDIGLLEVFKNPENIVLVEWAGKIKKTLPKKYTKIKFHYISENKRKISIS